MADRERLIAIARKKAETGLQERPITASEVSEVIRREIEQSQSQGQQ